MIREIKFRGKVVKHNTMTNPDNGWVEGFYYQDLCGGEFRHHIKCGEMDWEVLPETIGQYTGAKDKNGEEIYEGDIVRFDDSPFDVYASPYTGKVVFYRGCWCVEFTYLDRLIHPRLFKDDFATRKTEVLGNIHDNPELLLQIYEQNT